MINLLFDSKTFEIRNNVTEFTIGEFETLSAIMNDDEKNYIEKWSDIFQFLGVPEDVVDNFDTFDFIDLIKQFNFLGDEEFKMKQTIVLNDIEYHAFDEEFKLTVKEMRLIEDFINKNSKRYLGDILAVIYKRSDTDKTINFDKSHLHFKAELIRKEIMADVAMPLMSYLSKKLIKDYNLLTNDN
jgi:hypothetical protein